MSVKNLNPIQAGVLEFAQNFGEFTHLGTFTFAMEQPDHPGVKKKRVGACYSQPAAMRAFQKFIKNTDEYRASAIYFTEPNPSRAGHHLHALIQFHDEQVGLDGRSDSAYTMWRAWYNRYGRNRVEKIRNQGDVEEYVTKHCAKYATKHVSQGGEWWWACNDSQLWKRISN